MALLLVMLEPGTSGTCCRSSSARWTAAEPPSVAAEPPSVAAEPSSVAAEPLSASVRHRFQLLVSELAVEQVVVRLLQSGRRRHSKSARLFCRMLFPKEGCGTGPGLIVASCAPGVSPLVFFGLLLVLVDVRLPGVRKVVHVEVAVARHGDVQLVAGNHVDADEAVVDVSPVILIANR